MQSPLAKGTKTLPPQASPSVLGGESRLCWVGGVAGEGMELCTHPPPTLLFCPSLPQLLVHKKPVILSTSGVVVGNH